MNDLDTFLARPVDEYTSKDIDWLVDFYRKDRERKLKGIKTSDESGPVIPLSKVLNLKPAASQVIKRLI